MHLLPSLRFGMQQLRQEQEFRLKCRIQATKTFQYSGDSQTISPTTYVYIYVRFTSTGSNTPVLEDLQIAMHSNAPQNVGIDIGGDGLNEWTSQGMLLGTTSRSGSKFVDALNDEIPVLVRELYQFQFTYRLNLHNSGPSEF